MDQIKIGKYIQTLRKEKNMTQLELAEKLNISHQAVSKWENGETLPDIGIILELCELLGVSADALLNGGVYLFKNRKRLLVKDIEKGLKSIEDIKRYFGEESLFYRGMIEGINKKMNMDLEDALKNHFEILVAEVILQSIASGKYYVDLDECEIYFSNKKMYEYIKNEMNKI